MLALGGVSYALLQSLVAPALPEIQHALHTSENSVSWVLTAYLLSASVATPLIGRLGDMYGKERLLMIVLVLLAVGTLVSALATALPLMLVGRVIQGAAGGIFPLAFGIIRDEFPRDRVAGGDRADVRAARRRRRRRRRPRGADRRQPLLPLAVLAAADPDRHRDRSRPMFFVPESPVKVPGRDQLGRRRADVARPRSAVLVAVSETATWHWLSAKTLGLIAVGHRRARRSGCAASRARPCRSSTCG